MPTPNVALRFCGRFTNRSLAGAYYRGKSIIPNTTGAPIPPPIIVTSTKSAELIKHASNAFLATKISFINAVANICEAVGADIKEVCEGIGTDSRIGRRFLNPGIGYGGSCFPKDLKAFSSVARETGYDFRMLQEVMNINAEQRSRFLRKVRSALWTLKGKRLAVLGLSFKGGTDDIRESPAIEIVKVVAQGRLRDSCVRSCRLRTRAGSFAPEGMITPSPLTTPPRAPTRC